MTAKALQPHKIIRSNRRSMGLEVKRSGEIWLRAPMSASERHIQAFVTEHQGWLRDALNKLAQQPKPRQLTEQEIAALYQKALAVLPAKLAAACSTLGVQYKGISITGAQKRFGSCSSKGRVCFSYMLMRYPEEAIDYVVLHEAAHLKHLNHSKDFYQLIARHMPDYKQRQKLLKQAPPDQ